MSSILLKLFVGFLITVGLVVTAVLICIIIAALIELITNKTKGTIIGKCISYIKRMLGCVGYVLVFVLFFAWVISSFYWIGEYFIK